MPLEKLIKDADEIIEGAVTRISSRMGPIEARAIAGIRTLIGNLDTKGGRLLPTTFSREFVGGLEGEIIEILRESGYYSEVDKYWRSFPEIERNTYLIQKSFNKIDINSLPLDKFRAWARDRIVFNLQEQGLARAFVQPVKDALTRSILTGASLRDTTLELSRAVPGTLQRHVIQVSRDSLHQHQGAINQATKEQFGQNGWRYITNLVRDSRPQCVRWVRELGGKLPDKIMPAEIRWAEDRGRGWIPGTNESNFGQLRGGYNCRHYAIGTTFKE